MKVVLALEPSGGGSGRHVIDLATGLIARGVDTTVVWSPDRSEEAFVDALKSIAGIKEHALSMKRAVGLHDWTSLKDLEKFIKKTGPYDILHGHSSKAGALVRLLPKSIPGKRVYTPHALRTMDPQISLVPKAVYSLVERVLSARCELVFVGSKQESIAARASGISSYKIRPLTFGIHTRQHPARDVIRAELGLPLNQTIVGFVGRLAPQKAPERLLEGLPKSNNKHITLCFVGDGDLFDALQKQAADLNLANQVIFLGAKDGERSMVAFDVLAVPSRYESLGYVFLEGQAVAAPMIATKVGIADSIILHDENGLILDNTDDSAVWAEAIKHCANEQTLQRWKQKAIEFAASAGVDRMINETLDAYRSIVSPENVAQYAT